MPNLTNQASVVILASGKSFTIPENEFDKILSMAISALGRLDDASPMEKRALSAALKMESR